MRKIFYLFTLLILIGSLVGCGAKSSNPTNGTNTPAADKITHTTELTYLPSYNGIKSTAYSPATTTAPLAKTKFTIKNTTDVKVYEDYKNILKNDGWTITQEQKVISFSAKKDAHSANISIQISGNDVILTVQSK